MATKYKTFIGVIDYSHLMAPDRYMNQERYIVDFKPDDMAAWKESGSRLKLNDRGFFRPRRDVRKMMKGEMVELGAPKVLNSDGTPFEGSFVPRNSRVELTVSLYDAQPFGIATRLEGVRVIELAEIPSVTETEEKTDAVTEFKKGDAKKLPF